MMIFGLLYLGLVQAHRDAAGFPAALRWLIFPVAHPDSITTQQAILDSAGRIGVIDLRNLEAEA